MSVVLTRLSKASRSVLVPHRIWQGKDLEVAPSDLFCAVRGDLVLKNFTYGSPVVQAPNGSDVVVKELASRTIERAIKAPSGASWTANYRASGRKYYLDNS